MTKILHLLFIAAAVAFAAAPAVSLASDAIVVSDAVYAKATIVKERTKGAPCRLGKRY